MPDWLLIAGGGLAFAGLCVAGALWYVKHSMSTMFEGGLGPELTEADEKRIGFGLANRYWIDHESVVKVFDRETLEKHYGATFDHNGDVTDLAASSLIVKGFVTSLTEMDGHLNSPAAVRARLGLNDPSYEAIYGRDLYAMVIDLSQFNLRFEVPVTETANGLALFQEGGRTAGGARELQISKPLDVRERIQEIRRVTPSGYGRPFTPNAESKHAAFQYLRRSETTGEMELWNPWNDDDPEAWAVPLLKVSRSSEAASRCRSINDTGVPIPRSARRGRVYRAGGATIGVRPGGGWVSEPVRVPTRRRPRTCSPWCPRAKRPIIVKPPRPPAAPADLLDRS